MADTIYQDRGIASEAAALRALALEQLAQAAPVVMYLAEAVAKPAWAAAWRA
jgi:hypothetical protein